MTDNSRDDKDVSFNERYELLYQSTSLLGRKGGNGRSDSVLALGSFFDALLYFDEVHVPSALLPDELAESCLQYASHFKGLPYDDSAFVSKVDRDVYLLGDGLVAGYRAILDDELAIDGKSWSQIMEMDFLDDYDDDRQRRIGESVIVGWCAVQAGISGANSCMLPDFFPSGSRSEVAKASIDECSPIMHLAEIPAFDVSRLSLDEVLEIRRDPSFRQSLRGLRYFLKDEFDGLSAAQIEDKFLTLLESHGRAVARASDSTVTKSLSCFLGTSFWPSTLLLAATLLGSSVTDIKKLIAAGGVVAISAARTILEFKKANLTHLEKRDHPIDYVFKLREKTK